MDGTKFVPQEIEDGMKDIDDPGTRMAIRLEHVLTDIANTYKDEIAAVMADVTEQKNYVDTCIDTDFFYRRRTMLSLLQCMHAAAQEDTELLYM